MNIVFSTGPAWSSSLPIALLFWGFVAAYAIHILEESVLGETFVEKVRTKFFAAYDWNKFFWFNAGLLALNVAAVLAYEAGGGRWIILPLALAVERTLNGVWHFGETVLTRKFSSGLLASLLTWILAYFVVRYSLLRGQISMGDFLIACAIGTLITALMFGALFGVRWFLKRRAA